jgi:hypothetical protein
MESTKIEGQTTHDPRQKGQSTEMDSIVYPPLFTRGIIVMSLMLATFLVYLF